MSAFLKLLVSKGMFLATLLFLSFLFMGAAFLPRYLPVSAPEVFCGKTSVLDVRDPLQFKERTSLSRQSSMLRRLEEIILTERAVSIAA